MLVEAIRLLITLALTAVGYLAGRSLGADGSMADTAPVIGAVVGAGVGYVAGGVGGRAFRRRLPQLGGTVASRLSGPELFAGAFGVIVGLVVGAVVAVPLVVFLPAVVAWPLSALVVLVLASVGGAIFADRASELLAVAGLQPRGRVEARRFADRPTGFLLDSSAAIDGRVLDLARAGLVSGPVWVPGFVLEELQGLADSGDRSRRRRGRRGLDVIDALRDVDGVTVTVLDETVPEHHDVDAKLLALAERGDFTLATTDANLAKVASVRGVRVLNPTALGEALKPLVSAGQRFALEISRRGTEPGQGVGYLDDGTMVVVESAASFIGEEIEVEVTSVTRTSVGRMLFARPAG